MIASKGHVLGHEDALNNRFYTSTGKCFSTEAVIYRSNAIELI